MEIKHVRAFIAVAHALSFHRAARRLHLSQPALSVQIKSLETHLRAQLLERNRRTVRLTAAGAVFLADAEALLAQIAEAELRVARIAGGDAGHLRLGFVASATAELVPAIVLAFRKRYPRVDLELTNLTTTEQIDALRGGTLDAGFVRMPVAEVGLSTTVIHREPFAIVLPKQHPLARKKDLAVDDLAPEAFIAYGKRWAPFFHDRWTELCLRAGFAPRVVQETGEMSTALALVAAGLGVAIVPEGLTREHRRRLAVKVLRKTETRSEIAIATVAAKDTPLLRHLIAVARQVSRG